MSFGNLKPVFSSVWPAMPQQNLRVNNWSCINWSVIGLCIKIGLFVIWSWGCMRMLLLEENGGKRRKASCTNLIHLFHENCESYKNLPALFPTVWLIFKTTVSEELPVLCPCAAQNGCCDTRGKSLPDLNLLQEGRRQITESSIFPCFPLSQWR